MSSVPTFRRLDFTVLAAQFRLLPLSPAWTEVASAIKRLEDAELTKTPPDPTDADNVRLFADMLRRNGTALGDGLAAAAILASASGKPTLDEGILAGLTALGRACGFEQMDESHVAEALGGIRARLIERFPEASKPWSIPGLKDENDLTAWKAKLKAVKDVAAKLAFQEDALGKIAGAAWTAWEKRIEAFFRGKTPEPVTVDELLNTACGRPPGTVLRHPIGGMTVVEWSQALVRSLWPEPEPDPGSVLAETLPPAWLARVAVHALGFRAVTSEDLQGVAGQAPPIRPVTREWDWLGSGDTPHPGVVLVCQEPRSAVDTWLPMPTIPALALSGTQMDRLLETRADALCTLLSRLRVRHAAFEMPFDESRFSRWLSPWGKTTSSSGTSTPYALEPRFMYPDPAIARSRTPAIVDPKSLESVRKALSVNPSA